MRTTTIALALTLAACSGPPENGEYCNVNNESTCLTFDFDALTAKATPGLPQTMTKVDARNYTINGDERIRLKVINRTTLEAYAGDLPKPLTMKRKRRD